MGLQMYDVLTGIMEQLHTHPCVEASGGALWATVQ